VYIQRC